MQRGFYIGDFVDFSNYEVSKFKFHKSFYRGWGCGANALHTLTGLSVSDIAHANRGQSHFSDEFMKRFLTRKGYKVIPVTMCAMSEGQNINYIESRIQPNHVLLVSQLMLQNEASWIVAYNGNLMHNFEKARIKPFEFINRPILSAYVVYHKKWK